MQQSADFITADFLYMFRASGAHHQEYKILTQQPPVQVVVVAGGSSLRHIRDETVSSLIWRSEDPPATITTCPSGCCVSILYSWWWALDARNVEKVCSNKICILLHHVGVLFNLNFIRTLYFFISLVILYKFLNLPDWIHGNETCFYSKSLTNVIRVWQALPESSIHSNNSSTASRQM